MPDKIVQITQTTLPNDSKWQNTLLTTALTESGRIFEARDQGPWVEMEPPKMNVKMHQDHESVHAEALRALAEGKELEGRHISWQRGHWWTLHYPSVDYARFAVMSRGLILGDGDWTFRVAEDEDAE